VFRVERYIVGVLLAVVLAGCEVIGESERLVPVPVPVDSTERAHVLIEFTGFRCVNCPKASEAADVLQRTYGSQLIVVAMHPASNPFTQGAAKYDYTCDEADIYYRYFGGSATTPFPTGNIDFRPDGKGYFSDYSDWPAMLAEEMSKPAGVHLTVRTARTADSLTVRTTYMADEQQDLRLVTWLVEDSVPGAQALPDGSVTTGYLHRHMLRAAIGDPWGEPLTAGPYPAGTEVTVPMNNGADIQRYRIIAVLLDKNKQIVNAKQTTIQ